jgi:hypothetical protein
MSTKTIRDYYKILYLSQPGKGKTYSLINMDRSKTGYINADDKPLNFDGPFKYHARPRKFAGVVKALEDYIINPDIDVIVLDTISNTFDLLLEEMRTNFKGYDIWSNYNIQITRLLKIIKAAQKEIIVIGHYEILNMEGNVEKRLKVHGKEHEGRIEGHFTLVLYADVKFKDNKPEYYFRTVEEGTSAKSPPKIFNGAIAIPNDSKMVIEKVVEFAKKSAVIVEDTEEIFK